VRDSAMIWYECIVISWQRCSVTKTVLGREKTVAVKRIFRKIFKKEKIDVDKKKKNNAVNIKENTEAFKSAHHWKLDSKLNFNI